MNWINVNDQMPETDKFCDSEYLLTTDGFASGSAVAFYNAKRGEWIVSHHTGNNEPIKVTHWMPLPAPPK